MIARSACKDDAEYLAVLRDGFAIAALAGFTHDGESDPAKWNWPHVAKTAWVAAAAMLAARPDSTHADLVTSLRRLTDAIASGWDVSPLDLEQARAALAKAGAA